MTKDEGLQRVKELIVRFSEQLPAYKKSEYNETQTRRDFIDPFFKALGWDIDNKQGYAESYREVIHEDRVKVGNATKAPDYSFRLGGGKRLFFVEAKKPSVYIKDDLQPAYQVRRYGWSAKLNVSIITDFEEFAIYDCTKKPNPNDKPSVARVKYITYDNYEKEWDFIWNTFSKEAVLKGTFDKFIVGTANKKGTATVDKEFLLSLDQWRTLLAETISKENKQLDEEELNFVVQQTLDRIIFLRICEDRSIEPYGSLQDSLKSGEYYQNLLKEFKQADDKYNSGLFDFKKDKLSHALSINNKTLKTIINDLYYPVCPYEFSVLSVEILGSAYEQFLGKTITINSKGKAVIELKPEVRKAGGVYYTPQYIVDYIVENTIGKLTENKTPKQVEEIKIVDPACGSGSFLIGAYQYLLSWHKDYYSQNPNKKNPITLDGNLTTSEKKKILLNNIYGVDIDTNAVEVTKLSLLLKCMEGETQASIANQMTMFKERVLPTLDDNIKSGNSLIDTDYYDNQMDFGEERKIKPFSWQKAFPKIYKNDGFDVVIGNPPYLGGREWKESNGNAYNYFINKYEVAEYQFDIYALFIEAGVRLIHKRGLVGYITPNTWLNNQSNTKLRSFVLNHTSILNIVDYSKIKVFSQATVLPIITILQNGIQEVATQIFEPKETGLILTLSTNQKTWLDGNLNIININLSKADLILRDKIEENTAPLEYHALIKFGIKIYETGKGIPSQLASFAKDKIYEAGNKIDKTYRPYLEGKDINPYSITYKNRWLKYGVNLAAPRDPALFENERILVRRIVGKTLIASYTNGDFVTSQLLQIVKPFNQINTKTLLGILNSNLIAFYFKKKYNRQDKTFPEIRIYELASLPIKQFTSENNALRSRIETNVEQLLQLNINLNATLLETNRLHIKTKIDYHEDKINQLVYKLYNLTEEEIKLIEHEQQ